jgi:hypothetical protein
MERQRLDLEPKSRKSWDSELPDQSSGDPVEDPW